MATANDYFITQRELCSIAGIFNAPEYLNNNYATKGIASNSTFLSYITLDDATNSYDSYQFLEKKYVSKQSRYFTQGIIYVGYHWSTFITDLGLSEDNLTIRILVQASGIETDPNYPYYTFYPKDTMPNFYNGTQGDLFSPSSSAYLFRGESVKNSDTIFINGANKKITEIETDKFSYKEPMFILVLLFDGKDSSASPAAYCVTNGYLTISKSSFYIMHSPNPESDRILRMEKVSDFSQVPVRMHYDTDGKYKCQFYDGSLGQTVDYFI